jgi:DNA-binding NarL/FixJ family response regulator
MPTRLPKQSRALNDLLESLDATRRQIADLQGDALRSLPAAFGYRSAKAFLWAFKAATGLTPKRAKISPDKLDRLLRLTKDGHTRDQIGKALGIAPQTVSNIRYKLRISRRYRQA